MPQCRTVHESCNNPVLPRHLDEKKKATTQTSLDHFFKRVDRVEYSRELEPGPSMSGVSEIAAYPPSPAADCPSLSSPPLPPPVRNSVHLMLDSVYQW